MTADPDPTGGSSDAGDDRADGGDPAVEGNPVDGGDEWKPPVESRRRALGTVFAIVFVDLLGFGILIPIIPLYAESFGATEFVVGLLVASYSVTQFVAAPVLGRLSDERGRRPVLLVSLLGSVVAWTLFGLAGSLAVLFAARLLAGAMGGNIAAAQAYVADVTPPEDRAAGLGLVGAAFGLGFVFGPALGGVFSGPGVVALADSALPAVVPITEFTLPSFVAAAITAVNLVAAFVVLPETRRESVVPDDRSRLARLADALCDPALNGLIVSFFLFSLAFSGMEAMFVLFTQDRFGYGPAANGYLLAYVGVVVAVVQGGLVGRVANRYGERRLALAGVGVEALALLALPFTPAIAAALPLGDRALGVVPGGPGWLTPGLVVLLVALAGLAAGNGFANVALNTLVSRTAGEDEQGGAFGLTQSAGSIARAVGPVAAGALYTAVAFWSPFVAGGLLMVLVLVVLVVALRGRVAVASRATEG